MKTQTAFVKRNKEQLALLVFITLAVTSPMGAQPNVESARERTGQEHHPVSRRVLAFYYPWYGTPDGPGGAGKTVHWGRIDAANQDIAESTNYPALGAYDSHDPKVIGQHCQWAKRAGIDSFIVSWWGHGRYEDRAMDKILDACQRNGLSACIYYESVPRPRTPQSAADDIVRVLKKYGAHDAYLKINNKPVVFIYGRTLQQMGLLDWLKAIEQVNATYKNGMTAIGDQFSYGAARVFDGIHTYNTAGHLRGLAPEAARKWAAETYRSWVQLAEQTGKISALTVIPGYDDTKIRKPGLAVDRCGGDLYRVQWEEAIQADPDWILITSFNEWHEGSEIEPSLEYEDRYLDLTAEYAKRFKAQERRARNAAASETFSIEEKRELGEKLRRLRIGILTNVESKAFWWLTDMDAATAVLSWEDIAKGPKPDQYPILLYTGGEHYRSTVNEAGDVDAALIDYLKAGGWLVVLPGKPWPFYRDEGDRTVNHSGQFGLTLTSGWESPPKQSGLHFIQPDRELTHMPERFAFPTSGDLRWRPFFAREHVKHIPLLQLRDDDGTYLGDAVAYAEPPGGGKIVYVWFGLLNGPHADALLYDVFNFIAAHRQPN